MRQPGRKTGEPTSMCLSSVSKPLLIAIVASTGCAWLPQNRAATAEYARQVSTVSLRAADLEGELVTANGRLAQLEEAVRTHGQSEASRLETIDEVNTEIGRLRGQIEELKFTVDEIQRAFEADTIERERRQLHAERRLTEIEKFLRITAPPPPTDEELGIARGGSSTDPIGDTDQPQDGGELANTAPTTAKEALELGLGHMKAGRQGVARAILDRALQDFPGAPEGTEIRYRAAETWFNERSYGKAANAFQAVVDASPKSEWAPRAIFRQAECFEQMGQPQSARKFFEAVVTKYPKSDVAKPARQKLGQ